MKKLNHKMAAAFTVGVMAAQVTEAHAQQNFSDATSNVISSVQSFPNLISVVCYIAGLALGVFGVFKIKEHVDSPQQVKLKDGMIRVGAGGMLLALPFVMTAATNTFSDGSVPTIDPTDMAFSAASFT